MWVVAKSYRILDGLIYVDNPQPNFSEEEDPISDAGWAVSLADPDLFLSFARLGARGEPSETSILHWVSEHGLLRRADEKYPPMAKDPPWIIGEVNQAPITVASFRAEVLCAHQLLTLYMNIREENFSALEARMYSTNSPRHPSSLWLHTPSTDLENHFAGLRDGVRFVREQWLLPDGLFDPEEAVGSRVKRGEISVALGALQHVVEKRISNVGLSFDASYIRSQPLGSDYRIPRSYDCPDLLSALYLQFYLLVTDFQPVRRCENPACNLPFVLTRKNKRFCNDTCCSNARNYR